MKLISVIISAFNYGKYISEALQSLQDQTYPDWECIIIDDGSTDNTKQIVEGWLEQDARIRYFFQSNSGPSIARNNGIQHAKGDFIMFLDADDILQREKLKSHMMAFEKNSAIDIAYGDARYFMDGNADDLFFSLKNTNAPWIIKFSGSGSKLVDVIIKQNIMVVSSPVIKKNALQKAGAFDPKIYKLEDWELFQRLAINNFMFQFVDAPQSLVLIRAHNTSLSNDRQGMRNYFLPILEKHFIKSKLSFKNHLHLFLRMIEEYADLTLALLKDSSYPPRHYYNSYKYILPVLCVLLFPVYISIKIFRLLGKIL